MSETNELAKKIAITAKHLGSSQIVCLSGVPATGKSHIARIAAELVAGHEYFVRQLQFHPSFSYEDFVEGLFPDENGGFVVRSGPFLDWNERALTDPENTYVLLIEELSRANIPAVLGELMTFIEHRNRPFTLATTQREIIVAKNLVLLATMNPIDRSALEIDDAVLRRMRLISIPPSRKLLADILDLSLPKDDDGVRIRAGLDALFKACEDAAPEDFEFLMPFGHAIFLGVRDQTDLDALWTDQIRHLVARPMAPKHPLYDTILENFPRAGNVT